MKRASLAPSMLIAMLLGASGCKGLPTTNPDASQSAPKQDDKNEKLAEAKQALEAANTRLDISKMESVAFDSKQAAREENAAQELAVAKQKLVQFDTYSMPLRVDQEALNLKSTKENAAEAQEELEQIELMYKDQDLNDMTREFVIARGKRHAERAQAQIQIREASMASMLEHELPLQRQQLEMGIKRAEQDLASITLEGEIGRRGKALAVTEATSKVENAAKALAKLSKEASQ